MENNQEIKKLIDVFTEYRNLITPIESNLRNFASTFESMQEDITKLNNSFDGNVQNKLDNLYKEISKQFEKSKDLTTQIDNFSLKTNKFINQLENLMKVFTEIEGSINSINDIEKKADMQLDKLNTLMFEKRKNYDVKELEKNLDSYNQNIQKINEYINKDVANTLKENTETIKTIKDKNESVLQTLTEEKTDLNELIKVYTENNNLLKQIVASNDVNEEYIFDILDKWALTRGVKTKK